MKKLLIAAFNICLGITTANNSFAQTNYITQNNLDELKRTTAKPLINTYENPSNEISPTMIKTKVTYTFFKSFKNVSDLEWYSDNGHYLAKFKNEGRSTRAVLSKDGGIFYSVIVGSEKDLPPEIRRQIKSKYVDYIIGNVSEVNSDNHTEWVVNLHDDNHLIIARIIDGELDELGHYQTHFGTGKNNKRK